MFTEPQRQLLRLLRGPVSPQLPVLADGLIEVMQEDASTLDELAETTTVKSHPKIKAVWGDLRGKIDRYLEGVKAPVRKAIREVLGAEEGAEGSEDKGGLSTVMRSAGEFMSDPENPLWQVAERLDNESSEDSVVQLAVAVSGKAPNALTDEDFGRATGVMDVASALAKQQAEQKSSGQYVILLPNGRKLTIAAPEQCESDESICEDVVEWRDRFSLTAEDAAFYALRTLLPKEMAKEGEAAKLGDQVGGDSSE